VTVVLVAMALLVGLIVAGFDPAPAIRTNRPRRRAATVARAARRHGNFADVAGT
jgi:hypothetical protein